MDDNNQVCQLDFRPGNPRRGSFTWIAHTSADSLGQPGSMVVGLCGGQNCQVCKGPPDEFDGGLLEVRCQRRFKLGGTDFLLAHIIGIAEEKPWNCRVPYWLLPEDAPPDFRGSHNLPFGRAEVGTFDQTISTDTRRLTIE